jgi:coenzyme PQQ synthesis protein D (PqqD)
LNGRDTTARATRLTVAPHVHAREFDGELVVLDLEEGEYFSLNPVATSIWHELAKGLTPEEVASALGPEFDVSEEILLGDCTGLAVELVERGLMRARSE